jgi:hypothetical protein
MAEQEQRSVRLELLGLAEAAQFLGLSKAAIGERRRRAFRRGNRLPSFPHPVAELRCGPVWLRSQLEEYQREARRLRSLSRFERRYGPLPWEPRP